MQTFFKTDISLLDKKYFVNKFDLLPESETTYWYIPSS